MPAVRHIMQQLLKNSFWLALAELFNKGSIFLFGLAFAKNYGPSTYGTYAYSLAIVTLITLLCDFGVSTILIRDMAKDKLHYKKHIGKIVSLKIILSMVAGIVLLGITLIQNDPLVSKLCLCLGVAYILGNFTDLFRSTFRSRELMHLEAYSKIIQGLIQYIPAIIMTFFKVNISWIVTVIVLGAIAGLIITTRMMRSLFGSFHLKYDFLFKRKLLQLAIPIGLSSILVTLYFKLDTIMITKILGIEEAARYSVVHEIVIFATLLSALLSQAVLPFLSRIYENRVEFETWYRKLNRLSWITYSVYFLGLYISINHLIYWTAGSQYEVSSFSTFMIVLAGLGSAVTRMPMYLLILSNRQRNYTQAVIVSLILNAILNWYLIPLWGIAGAAIATCASEFLTLTSTSYFANLKEKSSPSLDV